MQGKDQEQFTRQLLYYLGGVAGGIPVSTLLNFLRYRFAGLYFLGLPLLSVYIDVT